ncbi:MAG: hypothetical protein ING89_17745 [Rubrivivax sp.]|nr:hypothetical protein [Rubrivivax sp.]
MHFTKIALAAAALCAAAAATAAPNTSRIALSAGASAIQGNITLAMVALCTANSGTATSFVSGNFTTVVCANSPVVGGAGNSYVTKPNADFINFSGMPFAEIRFNVANGSFGSVQILNGTAFTFRDPATLTQIAAPAGAVIIGGVSDVETNRFPSGTIGTNTLFPNAKLGAAQTFGVAASTALYTKMFDAQKAAGLIPASCLVGDTGLSYCIPNIAKAQMATIMANNEFNAAYSKGLGFLTGVPADDGIELRYLRRVSTSGTQAAAQNYFLGLPCSRDTLTIVDEPTSVDPAGFSTFNNALIGAIRVFGLGGTGDVRTELNKLDLDPGVPVVANYALGVVSGENNQTSQNWRWLRVDGAPIGENATPATAGNTNVNTLKDGSYSFYFELTYTGGSVTNQGYWATISNSVKSLAAPVGLLNQNGLDAGYNKAGLTCQGSSSN